ncbi:MAG: SH3 domain-containing protein [Lachnospiraceae bacterium]|nr:SH3 domain-containing protein [Lachnospiraceae bacterium]
MKQIGWFFQNLAARLQEDKHFARRFVCGCLVVVLVIVVIIVLASCGKGKDEPKDPESSTDVATEDPNAPYPVPEGVALEEDAHEDVNALVNQYFSSISAGDTNTIASLKQPVEQEELLKIEKESAYIEEFDNIKVYTKPGPEQGSYVTIAYYEIKFRDVERMAPGLTTFYITPRADGSLCIVGGDMDSRIEDYIKAIVAQDDVVELFATVNSRYNTAITEDAGLKAFMEGFSARVDQEVSEAMAAMQDGTAEGGEGEGGEAAAPTEQICTAKETVNVRSSDSENGEKLGKLQQGEKVTRYEELENGWSRVSYNGSEAFVKSEYLQPDEAPAETAEEAPTEGEGEQATEAEQPAATTTDSSSLVGKDTITAKESVNVRKSASEDGEKLGVAYQGEHYKLLQAQADGWCKIEYNGQTGYVKSEFVE